MGSDVLILTIYFLVVIYVLYQMALSLESQLEEKVKISLNLKESAQSVQAQLTKLSSDITAKASEASAFATMLMKASGGDAKKVPHFPRQFLHFWNRQFHAGNVGHFLRVSAGGL
ncbi:MAG: hypothetical protein AAFU71_02020, partial [Cyanobacteria bacterium J06632_22]